MQVIINFIASTGIFFVFGFALTFGTSCIEKRKTAYYKYLLYSPFQKGLLLALNICFVIILLYGMLPEVVLPQNIYKLISRECCTIRAFWNSTGIFYKVIHIVLDMIAIAVGVICANKQQYIVEFADKFWLERHYGVK